MKETKAIIQPFMLNPVLHAHTRRAVDRSIFVIGIGKIVRIRTGETNVS